MVHSFTPASFKGIVFLCSEDMFKGDQGGNYGAELSALANCWKDKFGGEDPHFFYTIPSKKLAQKITRPESIKGKSTGFEIDHWLTDKNNYKQLLELIDLVAKQVYK